IYSACKKMKRTALISIGGAICNFVVNISLIKFIGLYAASLSTFVSYIAMTAVRMKDVRKMVNIKYNYRHIAFVITVMILQASLCFMRNVFLDILNIVIGITFFTVLNKKMMITLWNKSLGKIRQKFA
ncbi:MAG: polysaccharide biosynthesis C-terminal domain-containing protein, partial [Synergistaceae bacterium]|nr:polysaccharide biosynthesis C-terminal domain-containing protein [Synergistaceae bacterium]